MKVNKEAIEQIMAERLLNKTDIADMANISTATVSRIFNGNEVSPKTAGLLARGLHVDIHTIL